ncbi:hypothetical protein LCGC14_2916350 [marine sediment metagenome]|uniref:Uncharacterized protein n=1 Tax=marine sediment metagenome TaxID=412755 RepID=A0A0F8XQD7_9ZZZZ
MHCILRKLEQGKDICIIDIDYNIGVTDYYRAQIYKRMVHLGYRYDNELDCYTQRGK